MIFRQLKTDKAFLIVNPINIFYLTGFRTPVSDETESYLIMFKKNIVLIVHNLYRETVKKTVSKNQIVIGDKIFNLKSYVLEPGQNFRDFLKKQFNLYKINKLYIEDSIDYSSFLKFKQAFGKIRLIPVSGEIEKIRQIKTYTEIENIKKASKITDDCFKHVILHLRSNMTERDIVHLIANFINRKGGTLAFNPIVAFGPSSSQPHYQPHDMDTKYMLLKNFNFVLLDFGASVNGYCADMTRVVKVQSSKFKVQNIKLKNKNIEKYKLYDRVYKSVLKSYHCVVNSLINGERSGEKLDKVAKDSIKNDGFVPFAHSLGHNLGLAIHESPRLTIKKPAVLKPGMVFTIEPGIYLEDEFGIRLENTVYLSREGLKILTKSPLKPYTVIL